MEKLPDLIIGDIVINPPIIQGGMGVRVSKASLASAVSNEGALGVIASVGLGSEEASETNYEFSSGQALVDEIKKAKELTTGYIGVNIMFALTNFESLANLAARAGADVIFSGAGLPLKLPEYVEGYQTKLVPIVSSARAARIVCTTWLKRYNRLPDAIVLEGALAGGHIGFNFTDIISGDHLTLEQMLYETKSIVSQYENGSRKIPLIAAGGVFTGKDISKMLKNGADGVQMATRFVCTKECDVSDEYKKAYILSTKDDIQVILSPVGMPARVIKNKFIERIEYGEKIKFRCPYRCLKTCDPNVVNYCIADSLVNSSKGCMEEGMVMCGANAYRVEKIVSVKDLISEINDEAIEDFFS